MSVRSIKPLDNAAIQANVASVAATISKLTINSPASPPLADTRRTATAKSSGASNMPKVNNTLLATTSSGRLRGN